MLVSWRVDPQGKEQVLHKLFTLYMLQSCIGWAGLGVHVTFRLGNGFLLTRCYVTTVTTISTVLCIICLEYLHSFALIHV